MNKLTTCVQSKRLAAALGDFPTKQTLKSGIASKFQQLLFQDVGDADCASAGLPAPVARQRGPVRTD